MPYLRSKLTKAETRARLLKKLDGQPAGCHGCMDEDTHPGRDSHPKCTPVSNWARSKYRAGEIGVELKDEGWVFVL